MAGEQINPDLPFRMEVQVVLGFATSLDFKYYVPRSLLDTFTMRELVAVYQRALEVSFAPALFLRYFLFRCKRERKRKRYVRTAQLVEEVNASLTNHMDDILRHGLSPEDLNIDMYRRVLEAYRWGYIHASLASCSRLK